VTAHIAVLALVSAVIGGGTPKSCVQSFWTDGTPLAERQIDLSNDMTREGLSLSCTGWVRPTNAKAALDALRAALRGDTSIFLNTYVQYPLLVNSGPRSHVRYSHGYLRDHFREIFSKKTVSLIERSDVRDFHIGDDGLYLGPGILWWQVERKTGAIKLDVVNDINY
jgi:hypothetical protein